jgi:rod shape-determining protein MreC
VYDKAVRRRRAVLAALVAVSLILLTAYYGGSEDSPLHSLQQGIVEVFTPIQEGAGKLLSPVKDLAGWFSSTLHAKSQNAQLNHTNAALNRELSAENGALAENRKLIARTGLSDRTNLTQYDPVSASAYAYNPQVFYESIHIDKGAGAGIKLGDPVLSSLGLVGEVTDVGDNFAVVSGLSAPKFAVEARILGAGATGGIGLLQPALGNPTTLQVGYVPVSSSISEGDEVVTAGLDDSEPDESTAWAPPGIPIGVISGFDYNQLADDGTVNVSPYVSLRNVTDVRVLTKANH